MDHEPRNWYALMVSARREKQVGSSLKFAGFDTYIPVTKVVKRWSDREKWVFVPLFPGWVFCRARAVEKDMLLCVEGVHGFQSVKEGSGSGTISEEMISYLRSTEGRKPEVSSEQLYKGEEVEMLKGPLTGLGGTLLGNEGSLRVLVRLDELKCVVSFEIFPDEIEKVKSKHPIAS